MIGRAVHLFQRYAARHGHLSLPGFLLLNMDGQRLGALDRISIRDGRFTVEGWAFAEQVGLVAEGVTAQKRPDLVRDDVSSNSDVAADATPGFVLDAPCGFGQVMFWIQKNGVLHYYALFPGTSRELARMRRGQVVPFLRAAVTALPAALRWFINRDPQAVPQIKTIFGLNVVPRSGQLDTRLFTEDVQSADPVMPAALAATKISIVLPVYNAFDLLPEVLERVVRHTDLPWRLIVVEDCSSDPLVRPWLRDWHARLDEGTQARVEVIENEHNKGFVQSVNRAVEVALPHGDHVVLLNSDAFVPEGWASRLIRPLLEQADVATVTPMSNDAEIFTVPVICQREVLLPGEADAIDRVARRFLPGADVVEAPTGVGFCMVMHVDYLKRFSTLDTVFGRGYGEEVDWCQRARAIGGRHLGLAGLFVEHRGGTSFGSKEKLKLVRNNNAIISRRYPGYDQDVQEFIRHDPLATPRMALALAWAAQRQTGAVPVYLAHDMGGGAEKYLQRRIETDLEQDAAAVVLRVGGLSRWQIELHTAHGVTRGETDETEFVGRLLGLLSARRVVYSCAVGDRDPAGLPAVLMALAAGPQDGIEVLIHDYFPLSPAYTLLAGDGAYHGLPDADSNTDPAHQAHRPDGTRVSLTDWRAAWGKLMQAADQITVFSDDSRALVAKAYPQIADHIVVQPHGLLAEVSRVTPGTVQSDMPVIGVLGNIGHAKGAGVLRDLSRALAQSGAARLVVVGNVDPAYPLAAPAQIHGDYQIGDISGLVKRYGIGCWLIPSIWPETFSYTTHEALATGLPVWSFDLGAQGQTVAAAAAERHQGGVLPLAWAEADVARILDLVLNTAPEVSGESGTATDILAAVASHPARPKVSTSCK